MNRKTLIGITLFVLTGSLLASTEMRDLIITASTITASTFTGDTITGSTVDSTPVGATTPSTGAFTALADTALTSGSTPCVTTGGALTSAGCAPRILAEAFFTSCTFTASGSSDATCTASQGWGATLPAGYHWWCTPGIVDATNPKANKLSVLAVSETTTTFTYWLEDGDQDSPPVGSTVNMDCWAAL